jgi:hypothetical protein
MGHPFFTLQAGAKIQQTNLFFFNTLDPCTISQGFPLMNIEIEIKFCESQLIFKTILGNYIGLGAHQLVMCLSELCGFQLKIESSGWLKQKEHWWFQQKLSSIGLFKIDS